MKRKVVALMLAGMMISGSGTIGHTVYAAESQDAATEEQTNDQSQDTINKSESVYVTAKANGTAKEIKVKETLKNLGTSESLEDYSELQNIRSTWQSTDSIRNSTDIRRSCKCRTECRKHTAEAGRLKGRRTVGAGYGDRH